jgi:hypothetical protein
MHHHLITAAAQATAITPATAELIGWGIVILAVLYLLNSVFGNSSN